MNIFDSIIFPAVAAGDPGAAAGSAAEARHATAKAREAERDVSALEERLDRLVLACAAMWSLIQEETDLREEDLVNRIRDLDLTDGRLDGKIARKPVQCVACGRPMSPRHVRCIYCGSEKVRDSGFDDVK